MVRTDFFERMKDQAKNGGKTIFEAFVEFQLSAASTRFNKIQVSTLQLRHSESCPQFWRSNVARLSTSLNLMMMKVQTLLEICRVVPRIKHPGQALVGVGVPVV